MANSTKKQIIAEKLLSDEYLTNSEILWLLKHLPDNDDGGLYNPIPFYDHDNPNINQALNMDSRQWNNRLFMVMDDLGEFINGKYTPSEVVEKWLSKNDYDLMKFVCFMCMEKLISDFENFTKELNKSALKKIIRQNTKK